MRKIHNDDEQGPEFSRRFARGGGGRLIVEKAWEFAKLDDEDGFREVLHRLKLYEGMERFDAGLEAFREYCHELRQRGHL